jgi:putative transposase
MTCYERNLPHWHPDGRTIFLTWRLYGSLPEHVVAAVRAEKLTAGQKFTRTERFLDKAGFGPLWLQKPEVATLVEACILRGARELEQYELLACVIMPNHVHLLIKPETELAQITKGIKGVPTERIES